MSESLSHVDRNPDSWHVLRDETRLFHLPANGEPVCGYAGAVVDTLQPVDRAGMWCSRCMEVMAARSPRPARAAHP